MHGVVDVDSPRFRVLPAEERAVGKTIAAAVIAAQMNLIHTLYVAPGQEEEDADETQVKIANEGARLLCGKALDLLRLETSVSAKDASLENARMKIDELSADAHASARISALLARLLARRRIARRVRLCRRVFSLARARGGR